MQFFGLVVEGERRRARQRLEGKRERFEDGRRCDLPSVSRAGCRWCGGRGEGKARGATKGKRKRGARGQKRKKTELDIRLNARPTGARRG